MRALRLWAEASLNKIYGVAMINENMINECAKKQLPFPKVIECLTEIGIERYYTDLIKMEKTYYSCDNESYVESMLMEPPLKVADKFDENKLIESIRASQRGEINYHTFLKNIAVAGVASYMVYIAGKQVSYAGRHGEVYVEKFPLI